MKNKFLFLIFILIPGLMAGMAKEGEELQTLDSLIVSSERQLILYKELRGLIAQFHKQQQEFYQEKTTKEQEKLMAKQMIDTASMILQIGKQHELLYLFSPFFIEELNLFAGISKRKNP